MNAGLDLALLAYQDGTLDAAGSRLLVAALAGAEGARVRRALAFDGLLAQALTDDEAVERSVRERLEAETSASAVVRAVHRALPPRRARRSPLPSPWSAAAAGVLAVVAVLVAGAWWLRIHEVPPALCNLQAATRADIRRGGTGAYTGPGALLRAGDRLTTSGPATVVWSDGSRIALDGEAEVLFDQASGGRGLMLARGMLSAEIAPQPAAAPFTIRTPHGRIEVVGTRFQVTATGDHTAVELHQGEVRLTRRGDGRRLTLHPREGAIMAAGQELVARALAPPATAPPATAPPATPPPADSRPLFPASGLAGWTAQHGAWSNHDGVVRGSDPHGKARLISVHAFADLELRCRLRIGSAPVAEVQVGDYNWFAEVPAHGHEWVEVRVRQRGEHLEVTADGAVLPLHAGAGAPARRGPLAFYVMPGGVLEISDALLRVPPAAAP